MWVTYPTLPYMGDLPYAALCRTCLTPVTYPNANNLPNPKDLLNSEFLVCLQIISGCDPLHTFAELSGAWEVPS